MAIEYEVHCYGHYVDDEMRSGGGIVEECEQVIECSDYETACNVVARYERDFDRVAIVRDGEELV